jgi:pimeloyl-ACP methyl ester carboxylesterase
MKYSLKSLLIIGLIFAIFMTSCSDSNDDLTPQQTETLEPGSGFYRYKYQNAGVEKELKVYYHIPLGIDTDARILMTFHGGGRNARDYRNSIVSKSERYNFIVIAPEFSSANFPGGDGYNLGNVFVDGDNPTTESLNPESDWAFSVIELLFDDVKSQVNNTSSTYDIYGHSAGGQFAHRLLMFKPSLRVDQIVASASGWYTFPDVQISFPYGFADSPLQNSSLSSLLSRKLTLQVGENDNNPNALSLRRNSKADAQGTNRLKRAARFFEYSEDLASRNNNEFNWKFVIQPNADHDYNLASENAADLLYK